MVEYKAFPIIIQREEVNHGNFKISWKIPNGIIKDHENTWIKVFIKIGSDFAYRRTGTVGDRTSYTYPAIPLISTHKNQNEFWILNEEIEQKFAKWISSITDFGRYFLVTVRIWRRKEFAGEFVGEFVGEYLDYEPVLSWDATYPESYSKSQLNLLLDIAVAFSDIKSETDLEDFIFFYRYKNEDYFLNLPIPDDKTVHSRIMEPYLKDFSDKEKSPINGRIKGLYFCTTLFRGRLPDIPIYGSLRIKVTPYELTLFDSDESKLFFADFFCIGKKQNCPYCPHYVTLVLTHPESSQYSKIISLNLIELSLANNPFVIFLKNDKGQLVCKTRKNKKDRNMFVNIFFTENVEINLKHLERFKFVFAPRGNSAHRTCEICCISDIDREKNLDIVTDSLRSMKLGD